MARISTDPDVTQCSGKFTARFLGIARSVFNKRVQDGTYPNASNRGKWDLTKVWPAHMQYMTTIRGAKDLNESKRGIYEERLKSLKAENSIMLGELIRKDAAEEVFVEAMGIIATRFEALPGRMAAELAGITDSALIRQRLRNEITVLRGEAANRLKAFFDHPTRRGDHSAPTYQKPRRVGRRKPNSSTRIR